MRIDAYLMPDLPEREELPGLLGLLECKKVSKSGRRGD